MLFLNIKKLSIPFDIYDYLYDLNVLDVSDDLYDLYGLDALYDLDVLYDLEALDYLKWKNFKSDC